MSRLRTTAAQELAELAAKVAEGRRLSRGRRYQTQGNVADLDVSDGILTASVIGSRAEPYEVSISCKPANENERRAAMVDPAGAVPRVIDVAFTCICPDWGDPCKHGVAVLLEFAREVDGDASQLLTWRGIHGVVAPPPPGTESLVDDPGPVLRTDGGRAGRIRSDRASSRQAVRSLDEVKAELDPVLADPDELIRRRGLGEAGDVEPTIGESSVLAEFFQGAMPEEADGLVGPLDEVQLDVYHHVRIPLERVDAAPVLADAIDAIADFWLGR